MAGAEKSIDVDLSNERPWLSIDRAAADGAADRLVSAGQRAADDEIFGRGNGDMGELIERDQRLQRHALQAAAEALALIELAHAVSGGRCRRPG